MNLDNLTPFAALHYVVVDQHGHEFDVVVARGTYALRAAPAEHPREEGVPPVTHLATLAPTALALSDAYHGEMNRSSVECESDLAPMKPRCDVIVLGAAHSPTGEPVTRIDVAVRVERFHELPFSEPIKPGVLLDHRLAVHGARWFERRGGEWMLSAPEAFTELPLRFEHAFGGELKVYDGDDAAGRLADADKLPEEVRRGHPEGDTAPVAHATCVHNPVGTGFLEKWYVEAAEVERWPAPRIEAPHAGIDADLFARMIDGEVRPGEVPALSPHGVGVVAKSWEPRLALAGTLDSRWLDERWPLMPDDFDMAYWNGAHPEMQCPLLVGGEQVALWNVLPRDGHGAVSDADGTVMRFELPDAGVVARFTGGGAELASLVSIDTVIIDLEQMTVALVWRAIAPAAQKFEDVVLRAVGHEPPETA